MAEVIDVVSKADFAEAQKVIAELRGRLESLSEAQVKERIAVAEKAVASKDEEIKAVKVEIDNVKASKKDVEGELTTVKASLVETNKKLESALAQIEEGKKVTVRANRISTLVDIGVEKVEAEKLVDASASADDNLFKVIVDTQTKLVEAAKAVETAKAEFPPKKKEDDKKKKEKEAAKADEQKLENAEASKDAALAAEETDETDSTMAGLSNFLSQALAAKNK